MDRWSLLRPLWVQEHLRGSPRKTHAALVHRLPKVLQHEGGNPDESSKLPLHKWVVALCLMTTNSKGVFSMKIHRDLKVSQPTAWWTAGLRSRVSVK